MHRRGCSTLTGDSVTACTGMVPEYLDEHAG